MPSETDGGAYRKASEAVAAVVMGLVAFALGVAAVGNLIGKEPSVAGAVVCAIGAFLFYAGARESWRPATDEQRDRDRERYEAAQRARAARKRRSKGKGTSGSGRRPAPASRTRAASANRGRLNARGDWEPPAPAGVPFTPSSFPDGTTDIVGESFHPESWVALFDGEPDFDQRGAQRLDTATLALDLKNPFDPGRAVSVWVRGQHVGYLPSSLAQQWVGVLSPIEARGKSLEVPARVWGRRRSASDITGSVTLFTGNPRRGWRP